MLYIKHTYTNLDLFDDEILQTKNINNIEIFCWVFVWASFDDNINRILFYACLRAMYSHLTWVIRWMFYILIFLIYDSVMILKFLLSNIPIFFIKTEIYRKISKDSPPVVTYHSWYTLPLINKMPNFLYQQGNNTTIATGKFPIL